jgi:uncharacterized protein YcfJ
MKRATLSSVILLFAAILSLTGCYTTPTQQGTVTGGLLGAGAGAIIGNQVGQQGEGALIGAAGGALLGALIGDNIDETRQRQSRYSQPAPVQQSAPSQPTASSGHWETRRITTQSGETYEERVWVENR